ncbi:hypothetical protein F0562_019657 [Nyssa sinensis]|uniref:Bulb-type lectin domain-containing protein n=1 Tax=Nyssa sinensis TaxID=561372 RepID=A0A5J5BQ21_9ASTE|nr:hypothetical protein F0562_019657 [Nyssa sinensis]
MITITTTRFMTDDGNTIVSSGGSFELGFFSPGSPGNRYLGIRYQKISTRTMVWAANREIPLTDKSGVLKVTNQGTLTLLNRANIIIWSSNTSRSIQDLVAQLLDSGNLVVRDANDDNPKNFLWQSSDYPGIKLGKNLATGLDWYISSWKSINDPSPGAFTYRLVSGRVRKTPLDCQNRDGFLKYSDVTLPDTQYAWFNESMNLIECEMVSLRNYSCMAYANSDVRGGSGCLLLW